MKITFIGSGNVATCLSVQLLKKSHKINQIYSRNIENAKVLAERVKAQYTNELCDISFDSDIYFICVNDNSISEIIEKLNRNNLFLAHCAGSVGIDVFCDKSISYGVFYPVQTISKNKEIDFAEIPICIEANNVENLIVLEKLATDISNMVYHLDSEQRMSLHLSAVFVNNFPNFFYTIAHKLLQDKNLSFEILKPLISETSQKINKYLPSEVQTGPAKRSDNTVIDKHLQLLINYPEWQIIYKIMSENIFRHYNEKR